MSLKRVIAVLLQEYYITVRSVEVIFDIFIYSFVSVVLFGFFASYLLGSNNFVAGRYLLVGILYWEVIRIVQYSVTVGSMWNIWSRNLSNMFIAPLHSAEYLGAHTFSGIAKALFVLGINSAVAARVFGFSILELGPMLVVYLILFIAFAFAVGIIILGVIFRFGTRIQAFAWGILPILQPLTAAFFPVTVLPAPLRTVSWMFPATYVFEAVRFQLDTGLVEWELIFTAGILSVIYIIFSIFIFSWLFRASRDSGQFARNES